MGGGIFFWYIDIGLRFNEFVWFLIGLIFGERRVVLVGKVGEIVVEAVVRPHVRLRPDGRATSDPSQGWPSGRSRTRTLKPNPNTEP